MYILKNAWKSITRNKGRNMLIGIIILVITCASTVALATLNSSNKLIESYENKYDVEATIGINRKNMMKDFDPNSDSKDKLVDSFSNINNITIEEVENYANSEYVSSYYYTYSIGLNGSNIEAASNQKENPSDNKGGRFNNMGLDNMQNSTDFKLVGYSSIEAMTDFINGSYTINDGEISFDKDTCAINYELATLNEISVGDTIELVDPNNENTIYKLKVTGIFDENSDENSMNMFSNSVNNIITTSSTTEEIINSNSELTSTISPTFILINKDVIDSFESQLYEKGMNENLSVSTNLDKISNATSTISSVKTFAKTFLIIVLVIGSIVLIVINAINIRERKYEIGVMRTIGMKKSTLSFQFMLELMIVTIAALIIGAGIGSMISVPISNNLLSNEIENSKNEIEGIGKNFGQERENNNLDFTKINEVNKVTEFTSIDATVDLKVLAELLLIGIGITMISSLTSTISIQKFSPLTILKERS